MGSAQASGLAGDVGVQFIHVPMLHKIQGSSDLRAVCLRRLR